MQKGDVLANKDYLNSNKNMPDALIAGDFNKNIASNKLQTFFCKIGIQDAHSLHNNMPFSQLDKTCIHRSALIDLVVLSSGIVDFAEGVQL